MSKLQALWIHGSAVQQEREGYFITKQRAGFGATFRTHGSEWFHFAIPTPVIFDGHRAELKKVFVLYKTEGTSKITKVHIYDGRDKVKSFDNISLDGDHSQKIDQSSSWEINPTHKMKFGLGISVLVDFGPPSPIGVPSITFVTSGADFNTP